MDNWRGNFNKDELKLISSSNIAARMEKLLDKKEIAAKKVWVVSIKRTDEDRFTLGVFSTEKKAYKIADKLNKREDGYWDVDSYTVDKEPEDFDENEE